MIKHKLEIVNECENYIINNFIDRNEVKRNNDYEVKFIKISNVKNVSAYVLIKTNYESVVTSKSRKKRKDYYCEVVFTGLRQPTKQISIDTYKILCLFINRFKISDMDICFDGENEIKINEANINRFYYLFQEYINSFSDSNIYKTSFYINTPASVEEDAEQFKKLLVYDKYIKESRHKKLDDSLKDWKRLEVTINVKFKLKGFNLDDYLTDIERLAKRFFNSSNFSYEYLHLQKQLLTDRRTHKSYGILRG
ncbi:hypothetical protein [Arcobacter arenosus]|uniref:hypothetical protein n=1 Tax=Arcobacter arenosus TaxID=2576037 RepID=UPI003BAB43A3